MQSLLVALRPIELRHRPLTSQGLSIGKLHFLTGTHIRCSAFLEGNGLGVDGEVHRLLLHKAIRI